MNNLPPVYAHDQAADYSARQHDPSGPAYEREGLIKLDFEAIWAAIYRSRFWIMGIVLGTLLLGVVFTILSTPIYRAAATVQIDQEAAKVLGTEDSDTTAAIADSDRFLQTQLQVVRSQSLSQAVAEEQIGRAHV